MKKLTRIAAIFIVVASFFVWTAPVSAATTDHLGGTWTPPDASSISGVHLNISTFTIGTGTVTVSGSVEIQCQTANINGTLTATGQGYAAASGPEPGVSAVTKNGGGGGGYGGAGGNGDTGSAGGGTYGSSLAPIDMGSGGGNSGVQSGGSGGGAIIIHCITTLTIGASGVIEADGNPGGGGGNDAAGGGAGGSIYITAGTLAGSGSITADGGAGDITKYLGGGGGGGRIAIHYSSGTFGGSASAAGGTATSPATPGTASTPVTDGTTLWRTYKDSGYSVYLDVFSDYGTEHTVYVKGTGLPNDTYTIVFWDASGTKIQVDTQTGTEISSSRTFVDASDPEGTWYASVYVGATPTAHTGTSGETNNLKADYAFYAYQSAIPEFSTVMAAIGVAGLCFGIYFWMRKRYRRVEVSSQ